MLPVADARARVRTRARRLGSERVPLASASGRFAAADVVATRGLPAWDNSAMDGFAVRCAEVPGRLPIGGVIAAGDVPGRELPAGHTMRIMTGAPIPVGADAVVMREDVTDEGDVATFAAAARPGQHIRRAGEDIRAGEIAVTAGARLGPGELGLIAALGQGEIEVGRRPRVALISTGDELSPVGHSLKPGQKYSSNAVALTSAIEAAGGEVVSDAICADDVDSLRATFAAAVDVADVVVSSGGVSAGDFDFVRDVASAVGIDIDFWKVAMKPGKPLVFGARGAGDGEQLFFGLPGNPVSTMVSFELFVRPALLYRAGARESECERPRVPAVLEHAYRKDPGRTHFLRAALTRRGERLSADASRTQGSGMLRSMVATDALVEVPAAATEVAAGSLVQAVLLRAV